MSYYASLAKIASAEAALGAPIALEDSLVLKQLVVALGNVTAGTPGGAGTVTSFSFTDGAGITGVVTNPTTTPALALTLGAITPTSVNGLTLAAAAIGFTVAGGTTSKTLTISNTLTLAGTDASTLNIGAGGTLGTAAFTAASAYALLGTANPFTAAQTISVAGANSTPPLYLTGALNVAGTGTTTFPHTFHQPAGATACTTWSSGANAGTVFGCNEDAAFSGDYFAAAQGGTRKVRIAAAGDGYFQNSIQLGSMTQNGLVAFNVSGTGVLLVTNGTFGPKFANTDLRFPSAWSMGWTDGTGFGGTLDLILNRKAAATLQLGADAAGVTNQMFTAASRITSDGVGANLTIAGGNGRGGAGGSLILSTYSRILFKNTGILKIII